MADLLEKFKRAKIHELLTIIVEAEKYTPQAIDAAKSELANRGIGDVELQRIISQRAQMDIGVEKEPLQVEYTRNTTEGVESIIVADTEDLELQRQRAIDTQIIILTIVFGLITIQNFTSDTSLLKHFFAANYAILNFDSFSYLLLLFMLPMGIFIFWLRYKTGWFILTIYAVCSLLMSACLTAASFNWMILDLFYVMGSPLQYILNTIVFLILLYMLWISDLRAVYNVSKQMGLITTGGTALLVFLLMYLSF